MKKPLSIGQLVLMAPLLLLQQRKRRQPWLVCLISKIFWWDCVVGFGMAPTRAFLSTSTTRGSRYHHPCRGNAAMVRRTTGKPTTATSRISFLLPTTLSDDGYENVARKNNNRGEGNTSPLGMADQAYKQQEQKRRQDQNRRKRLLSEFERDVTHVLKRLRASDIDPTLPPPFNRNSQRPSFTKTWTLQDWDRHTSRLRYWDYLIFLPQSRLLRRILPHLLLLTSWSIFVVAFFATPRGSRFLEKISINLTPLSLVSSIVFALETLRSNQGLARLNEGRQAYGKVVLYTRDMAQLIKVSIWPHNARLGMQMARHVALYAWLLKKFLRGTARNGTDEDLIRTMLNEPGDADYVLAQRKGPVAVVMRLRQGIAQMGHSHQISSAEELAMDHVAQELNHCVTTAERIVASPIPVLYSAHLGRLLMFYLLFLPLGLRGSNVLNGLATVLTTAAVGFAVMGLDEISHLLEQPFKYMPLYQLSKNSMRDVADTFVCPPPPTANDSDTVDSDYDEDDDDADDTDDEEGPKSLPPSYW